MTYKIKRQLKKLSDKHFAEDIKVYLKSPYKFYGIRVPEIKTLAKRLHEEHSLKDFYKIFNRLWRSGYHEEMSLGLYTLELYEKDFNLDTFKFLKPKLKDMKSFDQVDAVSSHIIGKILLKYPRLEKEIQKMGESRNFWIRRMAIMSTFPKIKKGDLKLTMKLAKKYLKDDSVYVQKATEWMLKEAKKQNPKLIREFILKNKGMNQIVLNNII